MRVGRKGEGRVEGLKLGRGRRMGTLPVLLLNARTYCRVVGSLVRTAHVRVPHALLPLPQLHPRLLVVHLSLLPSLPFVHLVQCLREGREEGLLGRGCLESTRSRSMPSRSSLLMLLLLRLLLEQRPAVSSVAIMIREVNVQRVRRRERGELLGQPGRWW